MHSKYIAKRSQYVKTNSASVFLLGDKSSSKMKDKEVGQRRPHVILWIYITLPGKIFLISDMELK